MQIFPEPMKEIDTQNPQQAVKTLENYVRYMSERIDFAFGVIADRVDKLERSTEE